MLLNISLLPLSFFAAESARFAVIQQVAATATQAATAAASNSGSDIFEKLILPVIISLITSAVTAIATSLVFGLHFIRERRATATFGFYACFRIVLKELQDLLSKEKNPFIALYEESVRVELKNAGSPGFEEIHNSEQYLKPFETVAERIRKLLLETDNNVYPNSYTKIKWYDSQYVLYSFTQLILDQLGIENEKTNRQIHITSATKLTKSICFLLAEIDNARFATPHWFWSKRNNLNL